MGLGVFPGTDPLWLGMLGMHGTYRANMVTGACDLMIAIGVRFDDRVTGRMQRTDGADSPAPKPGAPADVRAASHVESISPRDLAAAASAPDDLKSEESEDAGLELSDFYPSHVIATVKEMAGYGPDEELARALYQEGEDLYRKGEYEEAAERFKTAAKRAPDSPLQEDALFMLGESQFFADQYTAANETYAKLLKKYQYTRHLDTVVARQFAVGRYWEQLDADQPAWLLSFQFTDPTRPKFDTWGHALKAYQSVRMNDPTGPLADDSVMATANAYFLKGRYEDAAYNYDLIRKEYPKSDHQLQAHLLGMKSKLEIYQGPKYDGSPLLDAGKIADVTLEQFPNELGEERDRVIRTRNQVLEEKAQRDWALAQYYDKKKDYRAARYYYRLILEEYPTTVAAQRAGERLEKIKGLPDKPTNHFQWLTDLFPSTTD